MSLSVNAESGVKYRFILALLFAHNSPPLLLTKEKDKIAAAFILLVLKYYSWSTANIVNISIFGTLSISTSFVAAV